jgi:hypothetical protein
MQLDRARRREITVYELTVALAGTLRVGGAMWRGCGGTLEWWRALAQTDERDRAARTGLGIGSGRAR